MPRSPAARVDAPELEAGGVVELPVAPLAGELERSRAPVVMPIRPPPPAVDPLAAAHQRLPLRVAAQLGRARRRRCRSSCPPAAPCGPPVESVRVEPEGLASSRGPGTAALRGRSDRGRGWAAWAAGAAGGRRAAGATRAARRRSTATLQRRGCADGTPASCSDAGTSPLPRSRAQGPVSPGRRPGQRVAHDRVRHAEAGPPAARAPRRRSW